MLVVGLGACGGDQETPTFEPLPTPTTPPDFVVYTDESRVFSISYPRDWVIGLPALPGLKNRIESQRPGSEIVFTAVLPSPIRFSPNIQVRFADMGSEMSLVEYYEFTTQDTKESFSSFLVNSESRVQAGNREAYLSDAEFNASDAFPELTGKLRDISLQLIDGRIGWAVIWGGLSPSSEELRTCESVVRSFRLLE